MRLVVITAFLGMGLACTGQEGEDFNDTASGDDDDDDDSAGDDDDDDDSTGDSGLAYGGWNDLWGWYAELDGRRVRPVDPVTQAPTE